MGAFVHPLGRLSGPRSGNFLAVGLLIGGHFLRLERVKQESVCISRSGRWRSRCAHGVGALLWASPGATVPPAQASFIGSHALDLRRTEPRARAGVAGRGIVCRMPHAGRPSQSGRDTCPVSLPPCPRPRRRSCPSRVPRPCRPARAWPSSKCAACWAVAASAWSTWPGTTHSSARWRSRNTCRAPWPAAARGCRCRCARVRPPRPLRWACAPSSMRRGCWHASTTPRWSRCTVSGRTTARPIW